MGRNRVHLSLRQKVRIIEEGEKASLSPLQLGRMFGLTKARVKNILMKKDDLRAMVGKDFDLERSFPNIGGYVLDGAIWKWYKTALARKVPMSASLIKDKALAIATQMKVQNFEVTERWLTCFCRRHRIVESLSGGKKSEISEVHEPQVQLPEASISDPFVDSTNCHLNPIDSDIKVEPWTKIEPEFVSEPILINQDIKVMNDDQSSVISIASSSENSGLPVSRSAETFFQDIEREMGVTIPPYLKNALIYTGYDNAASLSNLDDNDFEEMQSFVRNQFTDIFASRNVSLEDYFGIFSQNIKQFQILPGHRKLLLAISNFLSDRNASFSNSPTSSNIKPEVCR